MKEALKKVWAVWKKVAHAIGRVQTFIIVSLSYFVIGGATWLVMKILRTDPLKYRQPQSLTFLSDCDEKSDELTRAQRQF
jgi:hypothetical protein